jgi:hypothetical protein
MNHEKPNDRITPTADAIPPQSAVSGDDAASGRTPIAPKKPKREKPSFSDLFDELKRAACGEPQNQRLSNVLKLLKAGYKGKVVQPDVEAVFRILREFPECSRLALRLSVNARRRRPPELTRFILSRLMSHARLVIGFPDKPATESQDQRRAALLGWLDTSCADNRKQQERKCSDLEWARWALMLLMEEPLLVRTDPIYAVLERCAGQPWQSAGAAEDYGFFTEIEKLIGAEKINNHRIAAGLKLTVGARSCGARLGEELSAADLALKTEETRAAEAGDSIRLLEAKLLAMSSRVAELEDLIRQKTDEIEKEKRERGLDEEHLLMQAEQRLVKMANEISGRLFHEIQEAKLCLAGDSPNFQMALDRLAEMEEALRKLRDK